MIYRVTNASNEPVSGPIERLQDAKDYADQFHRRDGTHYGVFAIEQVYTTSTLDAALNRLRKDENLDPAFRRALAHTEEVG